MISHSFRNRQTKAIKNQKAVISYLEKHPLSTAADIVKGTGLKGNIYSVLIRLVEGKKVAKIGQKYDLPVVQNNISPQREIENKYENDPRMPLFQAKNSNPLINIYKREIKHIQDGIDQLTVTKNYLERRVEELEDAE